MWSKSDEDWDYLDLLTQINKLTDDYIDAMDAEEAKRLLRQLRTPAMLHLVGEALEARKRMNEVVDIGTADRSVHSRR